MFEFSLMKYTIYLGGLAAAVVFLVKKGVRWESMVWLMVAYLPFCQRYGSVWIWTVLFAAAAALGLTEGKFEKRKMPLMWPMAAFLGIGLLSIASNALMGSHYVMTSVVSLFIAHGAPFLLAVLFYQMADRKLIEDVVKIILGTITLAGMMAVVIYHLGGDGGSEADRVGSIAGDPNMLASFFNYYIFLPIAFWVMNLDKSRYWLLVFPIMIMLRGIMVTFSRGGYLAFAAGVHAVTLLKNRLLYLVLLGGTLLVLMNPAFLPEGVRWRINQTFEKPVRSLSVQSVTNSLDASTANRFKIWKAASEMAKQNPVFGVGYRNFDKRLMHYWQEGIAFDAHNTFLLIASELGVPALCLFVFILLVFAWKAFWLYVVTPDPFEKALTLGFLGGFVAFCLSNQYVNELSKVSLSGYFWILGASIMKLGALRRVEVGSTGETSSENEAEEFSSAKPSGRRPRRAKVESFSAPDVWSRAEAKKAEEQKRNSP